MRLADDLRVLAHSHKSTCLLLQKKLLPGTSKHLHTRTTLLAAAVRVSDCDTLYWTVMAVMSETGCTWSSPADDTGHGTDDQLATSDHSLCQRYFVTTPLAQADQADMPPASQPLQPLPPACTLSRGLQT